MAMSWIDISERKFGQLRDRISLPKKALPPARVAVGFSIRDCGPRRYESNLQATLLDCVSATINSDQRRYSMDEVEDTVDTQDGRRFRMVREVMLYAPREPALALRI